MAKKKSGKYWVDWANSKATSSKDINDLESPFRENVTSFIQALEEAGATVEIEATRRSAKRAYLFHWAWKIGLGKCKPSDAKAMVSVDIEWDHGDLKTSKKKAMEMVNGFGLAIPPDSVYPPSLTSLHISGLAIDMNIKWNGTIKVKNNDGEEISVTYNENVKDNTVLHDIGASYSVKKLLKDAPHWSYNGD